MGSSAKKKKEKSKDFQKVKLKVGKAKPKAANFTDTSFKAKSIALKKQSLSTAAPTLSAQFAHHVSLLRNRSDTQRAESLAYLTTAVTNRDGATLPEPVAVLLPKLQPLIVDGSSAVRQQLLKLLKSLPPDDIKRQPNNLVLYMHVGMTHLSADIRGFAMEVLGWLLEVAGHEVVVSAGGWVKTLRCFVRLLGWEKLANTNGWSSFQSTSGVRPGSEGKAIVKQLYALASFISAGIAPPSHEAIRVAEAANRSNFPYWNLPQHLLPERSNAFGYLHLFGAPPNEEEESFEDREDRQNLFAKHFRGAIEHGIQQFQKEGGELGRASAAVRKAVDEGMSNYNGRDVPLV